MQRVEQRSKGVDSGDGGAAADCEEAAEGVRVPKRVAQVKNSLPGVRKLEHHPSLPTNDLLALVKVVVLPAQIGVIERTIKGNIRAGHALEVLKLNPDFATGTECQRHWITATGTRPVDCPKRSVISLAVLQQPYHRLTPS